MTASHVGAVRPVLVSVGGCASAGAPRPGVPVAGVDDRLFALCHFRIGTPRVGIGTSVAPLLVAGVVGIGHPHRIVPAGVVAGRVVAHALPGGDGLGVVRDVFVVGLLHLRGQFGQRIVLRGGEHDGLGRGPVRGGEGDVVETDVVFVGDEPYPEFLRHLFEIEHGRGLRPARRGAARVGQRGHGAAVAAEVHFQVGGGVEVAARGFAAAESEHQRRGGAAECDLARGHVGVRSAEVEGVSARCAGIARRGEVAADGDRAARVGETAGRDAAAGGVDVAVPGVEERESGAAPFGLVQVVGIERLGSERGQSVPAGDRDGAGDLRVVLVALLGEDGERAGLVAGHVGDGDDPFALEAVPFVDPERPVAQGGFPDHVGDDRDPVLRGIRFVECQVLRRDGEGGLRESAVVRLLVVAGRSGDRDEEQKQIVVEFFHAK